MLSDTEAGCLAISLAVCLKKEKKKRKWMEWLKESNEFTNENLLKYLSLSEPSDFKKCSATRRHII
jgi:hypothetical protein